MIFPAAPEDTGPFVGESTQGGLKAVAAGFALLEVGSGPDGMFDGFLGPLDEGLAGVFIAAESSVDFAHLSALVGDGRDAHGGGKVFGLVTAVCKTGERDVQTRRHDRTGAGQGLDQGGIFLGSEQFSDGLVVAEESGVEGFELIDDDGDFEQIGDGFGGRERDEVFDHALAGFPAGGAAAAVFLEESFKFGQFRFAQTLGRGPAAQEGKVDGAPDVFVHQGQRLRVVAFEDGLEPVGQAGAGVDKLAAALAEPVELFNFLGDGCPGLEFGAVVEDIESLVVGVGSVGAGMGHNQRTPVSPGGGGIERVDRRGLAGRKEGEQVGRGLFEGDQQTSTGMLGLKLGPPGVEVFGLKTDGILVNGAGLDVEQGNGSGFVGTIERDNQLGDCVSHGI